MYREHTIGVVVPAYNESELIGETLASIPEYVDAVYAIDDASTDDTADIIENFDDPRIVFIHHEKNSGVGAAIVSGYKRALEDGIDIAAVMAGDNQMDPEQLPHLLDPIIEDRADYTKGNRLLSSEYRTGMSNWRFFGNAILTFLTKIGSGYWQMMDPQNGYTAISKSVLGQISLDSVYPWYGYCNNLLTRLNVYGFRVVDVVMPARYGREKSKIKYSKYIVKVSPMLLRDFLWRLKMKYVLLSFHPLVLFYALGVVLMPIGLLGGLYTLYYKFVMDGSLFVRGVLSLLLFIVGMQFLLFAMLFDMEMDMSERGSGRWE
ncbi:glycosyltransferase family 2 protein [Methanosarcinales archaeon]|nr:MAG: glycosyltransferase family 2 protein [Methanosarcinales archaeon]